MLIFDKKNCLLYIENDLQFTHGGMENPGYVLGKYCVLEDT
jgi:hypothetical protein